MALNICTHKLELDKIKNSVYIKRGIAIDAVMREAHRKIDHINKVVKVKDENENVLLCWYNDKGLDAYLKQCEIMMQYDCVNIPDGMIHEKYICFEWANEVAIKCAEFLRKKTDKIPVFHETDIKKLGLSFQDCESIDDDKVLYLSDEWNIFNSIGIYAEQHKLLRIVKELRRKNVKILIVDIPEFQDMKRVLTKDEQYRKENHITGYTRSKKSGDEIERQLKMVYGEEDYNLYIKGEISNNIQYYNGNMCKLKDVRGEYTNVINGMRVTTDTPRRYQNCVRFIGPCVVGGLYAKDNETIPSVIQKRMNDEYPERFLVVNYGTGGFYRSYREKIYSFTIESGDLLVIIDTFENVKMYAKEEYDEIDINLVDLYSETKENLFFDRPIHMGVGGING